LRRKYPSNVLAGVRDSRCASINKEAMKMSPVTSAIIIGTGIGLLATYWGVRLLTGKRAGPKDSMKFGERLIWITMAVIMPFVWFIAFVVGGNFGGALAGNLAEATGAPEALLVPFGIGTGLAICIIFLTLGVTMLCIVAFRLLGFRR
jgi:hypothetical protein